ncbi:hypothetical protein PIB30_071934 [Stylosanthes scabra]|uniref:Serine/threonine-protein phosphatase 7 long form-like n=1 Tax=Stylosanthes scabra TaxID=79078 RepID=A0ABU6YLI6_9FABA|nr:hypothetical protein [Stylosanthes scabra]
MLILRRDFHSALGAEVWRALVPMILFHIVEYHQPDRTMTDEVWHVTHAAYIHKLDTRRERIQIGTPLEAPLISTSEYMKWYRRNAQRWIGRSSASLGQVVDIVEQLHISSSAPPPNFTLDSVHQATTAILEAFGEHDHTLLQQISQSTPPSQTLVQPPPEEVEQGGSRARRRRIELAANRTRLCDDESSSSSSHGTQSSTPAPTAGRHIRPSSISHSIHSRIHGSTNAVHACHVGGVCFVLASTWMTPSPAVLPSQHLKNKEAVTVWPRRQNKDIFVNSFKTSAFS